MVKICFFGNLSLVFAKRDYEILQKHFDIEVVEPPKSKLQWLKYPFITAKKVKKCDITFSWFAGWHSAFAIHHSKKYGKKSIVIAGGFDVVHLPEIDYGAFNNFKEKLPSKYILKRADVVVSISKSNQYELLEKIQPKKNVVIYNGVPIKNFPRSKTKKEPMAVTVGAVKWSNLKRKGIETFVKAARYLPEVPFVVIGKSVDDSINYISSIASSNVKFTGYVSNEKLLKYLQKAKVYVQPSFHEGFGVSVAEAMLCECIPVVTKRFALPEVVGDVGYYVPFGDVEKTALAIKNAMKTSINLGLKARKRINDKFSLKNRENMLIELIKEEGVY